jgi:hypothetical protein
MARIVQFPLEDGSFIYVEVDENLSTQEPTVDDRISITDEVTQKASQTFEQALSAIQPIASAVINKVKSLNEPANEVEVKFGVKMSGELGAVIAKGNAEVNYEITLKWNNKSKP